MPSSPEIKLQERLKELTSLYEISSTLLSGADVVETLRHVAEILATAWQFSESAIVELSLDGMDTVTGILPYKTVSQYQEISIAGEKMGSITVHYDADKFSEASFLPDEQKLLEKVAIDIASYYEKIIAAEKIALLQRSVEHTDRLSILGEMTAGIAHELNTPLGNILGFAELIHSKSRDPQIVEDSNRVIHAAIYAREIVKKLMFFACEMPQNMQLIKVAPIIRDALKLLEHNFKKADVSWTIDISDDNIEAQLDYIQLTQVLFNILVNAIYVSPPKSVIKIRVTAGNNNLTIEIADNGPGIPEGHRDKIFEPFYTTKPQGEGSGLGLSVVHGIVKTHKGTIAAHANFPQGTVFRVDLPLKQ